MNAYCTTNERCEGERGGLGREDRRSDHGFSELALLLDEELGAASICATGFLPHFLRSLGPI